MRSIGNAVYLQGYRGFESLPLRHRSGIAPTPPKKKLANPRKIPESYKETPYKETPYKETPYKETPYKEMTKRIGLLIALSIALGIHTPCYGLYVMVRSGFGELKGEDVGRISYGQDIPDEGIDYEFYRSKAYDIPMGAFKYKDHKNLSVALGGRFDIFDIGSFGLELEILGAYANLDQKDRKLTGWNGYEALAPDFVAIGYRYVEEPDDWVKLGNRIYLYLKNQRIAGAQINAYWEQYLLDWLSVGIGGGIGGAYVCTRFTTLEWLRRYDENPDVWFNASLPVQRHKYVHSGSLLYNFTLFVRAEQFETLFEVGYRHIGLHQMFGAKMYGYTIPKLANLHSDQIYIGVGRTF